MKRLSLLIIFAVACSSSVAQDGTYAAALPPEPAAMAPVLTAVAVAPVEPLKREPRKSVRKSRLEYEWMSKICVSEGGFNITECEKLLQTLENMREARNDKSLLLAMYAQSAKITRRDPFTDTRQVWVSYLRMQGTEPPERGWVECTGQDPVSKRWNIPEGCTGKWASTVKEWTSFRTKARELYFSGVVPETLPGHPIQWGGDMDYWRGVGRNFCPLNEGGLLRNTYWADPKDARNEGACLPIDTAKVKSSKLLSAAIASGRAARRHKIPGLLKGEDSLIQHQGKEAPDDPTSVD